MERTQSLRKNDDYRHVYREGKSISDKNLVLYMLKNNSDFNRIGISVSKKVGNSVVRHRIKRLVKENYRLNEVSFKVGYDIVVIARNPSALADFHEIQKSFLKLSKRQNLLED